MASATSSAVFAIIAKDAASSVMGKVGKSMGKLRGAAGTAFKAIAAGAAAAASAIAALAIASIKGAMEDEKAQVRLVATLRARGLASKENLALVEQAIKAGQRLGQSDDEVRSGVQVATQYTKNFSKAMKILAVAQDLAAAKEISLAQATAMVGKAFIGKGKALSALGVKLEKTKVATTAVFKEQRDGSVVQENSNKITKQAVKGMAALAAISAEYGGIADEIAETSAVRFEAAQLRLNEALETMGGPILDLVAKGLDYLTINALPLAEEGLAKLGQGIADTITGLAAPGGMVESVGKVVGSIVDDFKPELEAVATALTGPDGLFTAVSKLIGALWGDGEGALAFAFKALGLAIEAAFALAKPFFDALTWLVNNITAVVDALNQVSGAESQGKIKTSQGAAAASTVFGLGATTGGGGFTANLSVNLDGRTIAESTDSYLGRRAVTGGTSRIYP